METKHTPTPWKWRTPRTGCRQAYLVGSGEIPIAYLAQLEIQNPQKRQANAAFIVQACNSHNALLEACKNLSDVAEIINGRQHSGTRILPEDWSLLYDLTNKAKAAIALAEKGG